MKMLIYGLITGMLFGFFLQKGRVLRYDKQVGAIRLIDMTIVKFMMSSIIVGMVGFYLLSDLGVIGLMFKPMVLGANIIGGIIFGIGWGLLGYCPGTAAGALGEGRWDSLWGLLGMVLGAGVFAEVYPSLGRTIVAKGYYGQISLPTALGVNHWFVIVPFIAGVIVLFRWFEKKGL